MKPLEIGIDLYRYVSMSGIWQYKITGIRTYNSEVQYEVTSQSCTHGWACELLIAHDYKGRLKYVAMLNNDDGDDQSYWHDNANNTEYYFYQDKNAAKEESYKSIVRGIKKDIEKTKEKLKAHEKKLKEYTHLIAMCKGLKS